MELKNCMNYHQYDPSVATSCPECDALGGNIGKTVPLDGGMGFGGESYGKTQPINVGKTSPVNAAPGPDAWAAHDTYQGNFGGGMDAYNPTAPVGYKDIEGSMSQPVVGWLVCIKGPEKGKDYRIHEQNNYIGRTSANDICIAGDPTISRERHAIVAYDLRSRAFYFAPCTGASIVYHNNAPVFNNVILKQGDRIEIGQCTFLFVPLCGESFQWD